MDVTPSTAREERRFAVARRTPYDPEALAAGKERFEEFQMLHASQPGYAGSLIADLGGGELFTVTLWETAELAQAAREKLGPEVERILGPMMSGPSELTATGELLTSDLGLVAHSPSD